MALITRVERLIRTGLKLFQRRWKTHARFGVRYPLAKRVICWPGPPTICSSCLEGIQQGLLVSQDEGVTIRQELL